MKHYHSDSVTVEAVRTAARTQMYLLTYLLSCLLNIVAKTAQCDA